MKKPVFEGVRFFGEKYKTLNKKKIFRTFFFPGPGIFLYGPDYRVIIKS